MEVNTQSKLSFQGVDIVQVDFKANQSFDFQDKINLNVGAKVFHPDEAGEQFKIVMKVALQADKYFHMAIQAIGHFEIESSELTEEIKNSFINENAPAIMFPYVRSFITTFTANCGDAITALVIPPQFFKGTLEKVEDPDQL